MVAPRLRSAIFLLAAALVLSPVASSFSLEAVRADRQTYTPASATALPALVAHFAWENDASIALSPSKLPEHLGPTLTPNPPGLPSLPGLPTPQNDCGTGGDAANSFSNNDSNATPIGFPADCTGSLNNSKGDFYDIYQFNVSDWGTLKANLTLTGSSQNTTVLGMCVGPLPFSYETERCAKSGLDTLNHIVTAQHPGAYFAWLYLSNGADATYHLALSLQAWTLGPDCNGTDAGNTPADALVLSIPTTCGAFLNPRDDAIDWYAIPATAHEAIALAMTPNADADYDICLYADPTMSPIDCSTLPMGQVDRVLLAPTEASTYYLRVIQWDGAGPYTLSAQLVDAQNDCGTGGDGGSAYHAISLGLPIAGCSGSLDPTNGDHVDLYSFTLNQDGVRASLAGTDDAAAMRVCLYAPGEFYPRACGDEVGSATASTAYMMAPHGEWLVGVWARASAQAHYALSVTGFGPTPQDDCGTGADAPDVHSTPAQISAPVSCGGTLRVSEGDAQDTYVASLPASGVTIQFGSASPDVVLCVRTPDVVRCYASNETTHQIALQGLRPGVWEFMFTNKRSTDAAYSLTVALDAPYDDCGTGADASGSEETGTHLATPASCHGRLYTDSGDHLDSYAITVPDTPGEIVVTLTSSSPVFLCLAGPNGWGCSYIPLPGPDGESTWEIDRSFTAAGTYDVWILGNDGIGTADYELAVHVL